MSSFVFCGRLRLTRVADLATATSHPGPESHAETHMHPPFSTAPRRGAATVSTILVLLAKALAICLMAVAVLLLFGHLTAFFSPPDAQAGGSMLALLASGLTMGLILALPARALFGPRWAPMMLLLSGLPVASLSFTPSPQALAANGGSVGYVGAVCCTLVPALVAWGFQRWRGARPSAPVPAPDA
jgi:hypothetical protein